MPYSACWHRALAECIGPGIWSCQEERIVREAVRERGMSWFRTGLLGSLLCASAAVHAVEPIIVDMKRVTANGVGESMGTVQLEAHPHGVLLTPELAGLEPGLHGFHVHEHPSCEPATNDKGESVPAGAAGGHYDPDGTGKHLGPYQDGHRGDLPALYVDAQGNARHPVLAPRLKLEEFQRRALMIHAGGDNYSDQPAPLGGGAGRIACGTIDE